MRYPMLVVALLAVLPVPALACGGLFCATPPPESPTPPAPVDQNAERIIFEIGDGTISAHVAIQYAGSSADFAWVIPVPATPEVAESDVTMFETLDNATRKVVTLPVPDPCPSQPVASTGVGTSLGCTPEDSGGVARSTSAEVGNEIDQRVVVYAHDFTDNFEFHVVGAEDAGVLVGWLQDNSYNVSDNMTPAMEVYTGGEARFLAVKLRDGKTSQDIVPLKLTYPGTEPMIPIKLTAVAAQPLMGILVFIVADRPYQPKGWAADEVSADELLFDETGRTSLFEWAGRKADEADGRWFAIESVTQQGANIVSRFYTRLSPQHMTADPVFEPHPDPSYRVSTALDFSSRETLWVCTGNYPERIPAECAFNYCGKGATCGTQGGMVGCICPEGQVAQTITGPEGLPTVTCVPPTNPLGITPDAGGGGGEFDPCAKVDCDEGSCVLKAGFPTCDCNDNTIACLEEGLPRCVLVGDDLLTFGPGAGLESAPTVAASAPKTLAGEDAVAFAGATLPGARTILFLLFLGGLALLRRRRVA
jgi:hypothetical protein